MQHRCWSSCMNVSVGSLKRAKGQDTQMYVLRMIEVVCWKDQIANDRILWRLGQVGLLELIEEETGVVERNIKRDGQ